MAAVENVEIETTRVVALGCLALGRLSRKFNKHGTLNYLVPAICLSLRRVREAQGDEKLCTLPVPVGAYIWLATHAPLLSFLGNAGSVKILPYAFERLPKKAEDGMQTLKLQLCSLIRNSCGEPERADHVVGDVGHDLPQIREFLALLISLGTDNDVAFLTSCILLHAGLMLVLKPERQQLTFRSCTLSDLLAAADSVLNSFGPGAVRDRLLYIKGDSTFRHVLSSERNPFCRKNSSVKWLSSTERAVQMVPKRLIQLALAKDEAPVAQQATAPEMPELMEAYEAIVHIFAADASLNGPESVCGTLGFLPYLQGEVARFLVQQAPRAQQPEAVRVILPENQIPQLAGAVAQSDTGAPDLITAEEAQDGLAAGSLIIDHNERGDLRLMRVIPVEQQEPVTARLEGAAQQIIPPIAQPITAPSLDVQLGQRLSLAPDVSLPARSRATSLEAPGIVSQKGVRESTEQLGSARPIETDPAAWGTGTSLLGSRIERAPQAHYPPPPLVDRPRITAQRLDSGVERLSAVYEMKFIGTQLHLAQFPANLKDPQGGEGDDGIVAKDDESEETMLALLPENIRTAIAQCLQQRRDAVDPGAVNEKRLVLIEAVLDAGRPVVLQFLDGSQERLQVTSNTRAAVDSIGAGLKQMREEGGGYLPDNQPPGKLVDSLLTVDNRLGIPGTLHRISAMRNRADEIVGLTCRIGRHISGESRLLLDVIAKVAPAIAAAGQAGSPGMSLLLLGPPGVGKTTLLRDIICMLANRFQLGAKCLVVDTSNEIGGFGDVPHPAIGDARRFPVKDRSKQHKELLEAVQNHTPSVVIVDEISTGKEAEAIKAVGHRGVVMVATAHGNCIGDIIKNPELNILVGGISEVTVGDRTAAMTNRGKKTRLERQGPPVFPLMVEVLSFNAVRVHMDVAKSVDSVLSTGGSSSQKRWLKSGLMALSEEASQEPAFATTRNEKKRPRDGTQQDVLAEALPRFRKRFF